MSQTPKIVFALSVMNLLLCAAGLLFAYFDWNAARRREYLYLYFTEEKPGYDYFSAARRRRIQYTRLVVAFGILSLRNFLALMAVASVSQTSVWADYVNWFRDGGLPKHEIRFAVALYPWLNLLEVLGLAWLGFALLYELKHEKDKDGSMLPALLISGFATLWAIFVLCFVAGAFGERGGSIVNIATVASRIVLLIVFMAVLAARQNQPMSRGLLEFNPNTFIGAFAAWLVAGIVILWAKNPSTYALWTFVAYFLIVYVLAKATLNDYESIELTRHRLGRERGVIYTFLKRLGAAFTTDLEVDQILKIILESALETTEASAGAIYLVDTKANHLEPRVVLNFFPPLYVTAPYSVSDRRTEELEEEMRRQRFALGEGIIGEVAKTGKPQLISDVRAAGILQGTTTEYMRNRSMLVVPLRVRDETLGVMAVLNKQRGSFTMDDEALLQALADQASLSINNAMLTVEMAKQEGLRRDLQIARDIQQRLLPDHCPQIPGFSIAARGTSALEVGGDYYDFFWVDEDHLGIVVADVSGKGVYAALVVAMIRSAFRTQAPGNPDVRDVLARVNAFISEDLRRDMFVTCVYGILEISTKRFSWARAGHEPILVAHPEREVDVLRPDGFALGVIGSPDFSDLLEVNTIELHSGDRLLLFTDGLTEAMNAHGEEFGMDRILKQFSFQCATTHDGNGISDGTGCESTDEEPEEMRQLEEAVSNHVNGAPQSDDLTIVYLAAK